MTMDEQLIKAMREKATQLDQSIKALDARRNEVQVEADSLRTKQEQQKRLRDHLDEALVMLAVHELVPA